jgi:hypothetical protein
MLVAGFILSCKPDPYEYYYRVVVQAADGEVLYDGQGPDYNFSFYKERGITSKDVTVLVLSYHSSGSQCMFRVTGPGLRATREFVERMPRRIPE